MITSTELQECQLHQAAKYKHVPMPLFILPISVVYLEGESLLTYSSQMSHEDDPVLKNVLPGSAGSAGFVTTYRAAMPALPGLAQKPGKAAAEPPLGGSSSATSMVKSQCENSQTDLYLLVSEKPTIEKPETGRSEALKRTF